MRANDFRALLVSGSTRDQVELPSSHVSALKAIAKLFDTTDRVSVATTLGAVDKTRLSGRPGFPTIAIAREALATLKSVLPPAIRRGVTKDVAALTSLMEGHGSDSVISFVESVRSQFPAFASPRKGQRKRGTVLNKEVVRTYVRRLEEALRDDRAFPALVHAMEHDPLVRQDEIVEIANDFYGPTPQGASKKESVRRIMSRHRSLMDYRAKAKAQAGKSAA
jgi:hypothetical protein